MSFEGSAPQWESFAPYSIQNLEIFNMMNSNQVRQSIAYCGLICKLCFLADQCDGCKTIRNSCEQNCSEQGCFQKKCCEEKQFEGCWECEGLQGCNQGMYAAGEYSKIKAFALCIQQDGMDAFVSYVLANQAAGFSVEKGRDYDGKPISVVLKMLRSGCV